MTLATNLKRALYRVRSINGRLGLRPHSVEMIDTSWSGPQVGDGIETIWSWPVTEYSGENPKVRWLTTEEIAVGSLLKGTVTIGPITPNFTGGGTELLTLI
ncbi:MAG: hypothetical protein ABI632_12800, partial [Pseudolysinimonas sp.]